MLIREEVEFHSECWGERCKALYVPEHEKISLKNEVKQTKDDATKGHKVNHERHASLCPANKNIVSIDAVQSWASKYRQFRASSKDVKHQDIRKFGLTR